MACYLVYSRQSRDESSVSRVYVPFGKCCFRWHFFSNVASYLQVARFQMWFSFTFLPPYSHGQEPSGRASNVLYDYAVVRFEWQNLKVLVATSATFVAKWWILNCTVCEHNFRSLITASHVNRKGETTLASIDS